MLFCPIGQSVFDPVWSNKDQNIGQCFLDVIVLGFPVQFLIVTVVVSYFIILMREKTVIHSPRNKIINFSFHHSFSSLFLSLKNHLTAPDIFELFQILLLVVLPVFEYIALFMHAPFTASTGSQIFSTIVISIGWGVSALCLSVLRARQIYFEYSWCLSFFWLLTFMMNCCKLFYYIRLVVSHGWFAAVSIFSIYFILSTSQFVTSIFFRKFDPSIILNQKMSPENRASIFSKSIFSWINPLLDLGQKRPLEQDDIEPLSHRDKVETLKCKFNREWTKELLLPKEKRSLFRALRRAHGSLFYFAGILKIFQTLLMFLPPLLLNIIIKFIGDPDQPSWYGYTIIFSMFVTSIAQTIFLNQYFLICFRTGMNLTFFSLYLLDFVVICHVFPDKIHTRTSLVAAIYQKTLTLSVSSRTKFSQVFSYFFLSIIF